MYGLSHEPRLVTQGQHALTKISFLDTNLKEVDLQHQDALVVTLQVGNFKVKMILIDSVQTLISYSFML